MGLCEGVHGFYQLCDYVVILDKTLRGGSPNIVIKIVLDHCKSATRVHRSGALSTLIGASLSYEGGPYFGKLEVGFRKLD